MFSGSSCTASNTTVRVPPHEAMLVWLRDHGCDCLSQPSIQPESQMYNASCDRAAEIWPAAKGFFWMSCGAGIGFVSIDTSHYTVIANATLPHHVRVARAHATSKALFLILSVSALASESSTSNNIPEGVWRVTVSHSSRGPFLRLRVLSCSPTPLLLDTKIAFAAHASGDVALVSSSSLLVISSSLVAVRYVRFQSRSPEGHFQVSYVSVHTADGSNVAYSKPVSVSGSYPESAPCSDVVKGQPEARNHPVCNPLMSIVCATLVHLLRIYAACRARGTAARGKIGWKSTC